MSATTAVGCRQLQATSTSRIPATTVTSVTSGTQQQNGRQQEECASKNKDPISTKLTKKRFLLHFVSLFSLPHFFFLLLRVLFAFIFAS